MAEYLIFDPVAQEAHRRTLAPDQVPFNTNGGLWHVLELDGEYRSVTFAPGSMTETFDFDAIRRPLLRKIDAEALALTADPFAAVHAAKEAEARASGRGRLILAEAEATAQCPATVARAVIAKADAARARVAAIEVKRIAAKRALAAADSIPALIEASKVAWEEPEGGQ